MSRDLLLRVINGVRKVAAGLRPFSESVWPGVRNDLFVAHESIYFFASSYAAGRRVLDAGCGTGYGSAQLARSGATSVVGVDLDAANVRYATRHYGAPNVTFRTADLERLDFPPASFDLVVASNSLEHLHDPDAFVASLRSLLASDGVAIIAVPPIVSAADAATHAHIHYHRSNLNVRAWHELFARGGFDIECITHRARRGVAPDVHSRRTSRYTAADFVFAHATLDALCAEPTITAVFVLQPRR